MTIPKRLEEILDQNSFRFASDDESVEDAASSNPMDDAEDDASPAPDYAATAPSNNPVTKMTQQPNTMLSSKFKVYSTTVSWEQMNHRMDAAHRITLDSSATEGEKENAAKIRDMYADKLKDLKPETRMDVSPGQPGGLIKVPNEETEIEETQQGKEPKPFLQLNVPRPLVNAPTPAHPMNMNIVNQNMMGTTSSKLFQLIEELAPIKQANVDKEDLILQEIMGLKEQLNQLVGNGESLVDVIRHDQGHDDWHHSMGQEPCTSDEDCAAKRAEHEVMQHQSEPAPAFSAHPNEWSPSSESMQEKVQDHDYWAEQTHHGEYDMPGPKKPLPPTTWE